MSNTNSYLENPVPELHAVNDFFQFVTGNLTVESRTE